MSDIKNVKFAVSECIFRLVDNRPYIYGRVIDLINKGYSEVAIKCCFRIHTGENGIHLVSLKPIHIGSPKYLIDAIRYNGHGLNDEWIDGNAVEQALKMFSK